jgi:hypothetical protein
MKLTKASLVALAAISPTATEALASNDAYWPDGMVHWFQSSRAPRVPIALRDPFAVKQPPPPPSPVVLTPSPQPPPPPAAPPLPFKYVGAIGSGKGRVVLLEYGDKLIQPATGEVIDDLYRVDQILVGAIVFLHLPTNMQQTLALESSE